MVALVGLYIHACHVLQLKPDTSAKAHMYCMRLFSDFKVAQRLDKDWLCSNVGTHVINVSGAFTGI
jgi:hypothetical protein